jgi:hypothetical protein
MRGVEATVGSGKDSELFKKTNLWKFVFRTTSSTSVPERRIKKRFTNTNDAHVEDRTTSTRGGHVLNTLLRAGAARGSTGNSRE